MELVAISADCSPPGLRPQITGGITTGKDEPEYFHILLCELRIHLDQSRGDCGKTNHHCSGDFDSVSVQLTRNLNSDGVLVYFSV